jgi:hypothetical protein
VISVNPDWFSERGAAPDVLKIDVEGAEFDVLRGRLRILSQSKPVILCAVSDHVDEVSALFADHRYMFYGGDSHLRAEIHRASFNRFCRSRTA